MANLEMAEDRMQDVSGQEKETIQVEKVITPGQMVMKRFLRNKLAIVGIVLIAAMLIFSFIGPLFSSYGEYDIFFTKDGVELAANSEDTLQEGTKILTKAPISSTHLLGTDRDGRDVLTRLMYGGRISLMVGIVVIAIEVLIGIVLGGIAGYYGGWIDNIIMRIVDVFNCIPTLPIMLILSSAMLALGVPQQSKIYVLMLALGLLGWASVARLVRGQILSLRDQEYMVATEAIGLRPAQKIFKHLIPNVMPQLIVFVTLGIGNVILMESSLSYLGIGVPFPYASWGNMVNAVTDPIIMKGFLNIWAPPGLCILITVLGFNFIDVQKGRTIDKRRVL